jgi:hypothetical protein
MNHQPFRDWLLSEEDLSAEHARLLHEHLADCEACNQLKSSWTEVEKVIHTSPQVAPEPGFTHRWQARLAEYETRQKNRQGWLSIGITAFIALILVFIVAYQVWGFLQDPAPFIAAGFDQLVGLISDYFILQRLVNSNGWFTPVNVLVGSFFLVGMISFMCVLWMTAYQKFNLLRRIE